MFDSEGSYDVDETPHFTFIWTIENIRLPIYTKCPIFTAKNLEMTQWSLFLSCASYGDVFLSIYRERDDDGPDSIEIKCELSLLRTDGLPLIKKVEINKFEICSRIVFDFPDELEVFLGRRNEFLPNDELTIRCRMWRTGTEILKPDLCFARTRFRPNRLSFVWAVREFSSLRTGQVRKLFLDTTSTEEITLEFFIKETEGKEYINVVFGDSLDAVENIKMCLLDFEGKVVHFANDLEFTDFFEKDRLTEDKDTLLPNDVLTLRCEIELAAETEWNRIENYRYLNSINSNVIATDVGEILLYEQDEAFDTSSSYTKDMERLLEEGDLSDVILRTRSKSFPAHKCVLSARSPVFKAMFKDVEEKASKYVEIPDMDGDTLRDLLSYIYTNEVGELKWQSALKFYRAADEYELLDLKKKCSIFFRSHLSASNACAVLILADTHHDQRLRGTAKDFIINQRKEFFTSDAWRSFKEENFKLYVEILEQMAFRH
ncbi:speckle-type POZ protein B-like [Argiope bruennichi]|uniref:speckle-type POZ protein B-like n=1 Tax=Argiope bruennichi TaxID=94029 RepID=UPI002493EB41|nr:speckle-type POZ protein B-like [Argiope bruennichi]